MATLFLSYIDEGYYNFKWMARPGNRIPFVFYSGALLGIQMIVSELLFGNFSTLVKSIASILTAATLLILMMPAFAK